MHFGDSCGNRQPQSQAFGMSAARRTAEQAQFCFIDSGAVVGDGDLQRTASDVGRDADAGIVRRFKCPIGIADEI